MRLKDFQYLAEEFKAFLFARQPQGEPDSLYAPIRYINTLGGKHIRPTLLLMAYNLWQDDLDEAMPAALAVEYFHNFSLMHDDIMDAAPLRRGRPSVHKVYGHNSAILSGDAMMIQCFAFLLESGKERGCAARLCEVMSQAALEICEGQQLDMDFEKMDSPKESQYLEMIRQKTACLLGTSMRLGAILAGAEKSEAELLYTFGEKLGLGFQIQDDILDVFGDASLTGKQKGGDILQGKKNFLYVAAYTKLTGQARDGFTELYAMAGKNKDTAPVYQVYNELNLESYASEVQYTYVREAVACLEKMETVDTKQIRMLTDQLASRKY